jgi:hypothetical protein
MVLVQKVYVEDVLGDAGVQNPKSKVPGRRRKKTVSGEPE